MKRGYYISANRTIEFLNITVYLQYLSSANLTTNEDIKGSYSSKRTHANFNPFSAGSLFANCNEVLCSPLNPSLIDATGLVTDQFIAERKLSQLQAEIQQQIPAAQIGILMQPPRHAEPNLPGSNMASYPRQPQVQVTQNTANPNSFHSENPKLILPNKEQAAADGKIKLLLR